MADWRGSRTGGFFARKVTWPDFREVGPYEDMTGGTLELSALSDLKASGTIAFDGEAPDPDGLLRIYYAFADAQGEREEVPVATMTVRSANPTVTDGGKVGDAELCSVLKILQDVELNAPYTVKAGEQVIAKALSILADRGLPTNNPDPSAYALSRDYTFAPDEANLLHIVNTLLGFAGYSSAWVDQYGVVQITPYEEPTEREAVMRFAAGEDSVMYPEIGCESNWDATPNVARLSYSTDVECLTAWAANVDPAHPASLPSRGGRERTVAEAVIELAGDTQEERLSNLEAEAVRKISDNSAEIEYADIACAFLPVVPNDAVEVDFGGVSWKGAAVNCRINMDDDSEMSVRVRRFTRRALKVESGREVVW